MPNLFPALDGYRTIWFLNVATEHRARLQKCFPEAECVFPSVRTEPGSLAARIRASEAPLVVVWSPKDVSTQMVRALSEHFTLVEAGIGPFTIEQGPSVKSMGYYILPMSQGQAEGASGLLKREALAAVLQDAARLDAGRTLLKQYCEGRARVASTGLNGVDASALFAQAKAGQKRILAVGHNRLRSVQQNLESLIEEVKALRGAEPDAHIAVVSNTYLTLNTLIEADLKLRVLCDEIWYQPWLPAFGAGADEIWVEDLDICLDAYLRGLSVKCRFKSFYGLPLAKPDADLRAAAMAVLQARLLWLAPSDDSRIDMSEALAWLDEQVGAQRPAEKFALADVARKTYKITQLHRSLNYAEAKACTEEVLADFPGDISLWMRLGDIHMDMEDFGGAFDAYSKAVDLAPEDGRTYSKRARARSKMGIVDDQTSADLLKAAALTPGGNFAMLGRYFDFEWERAPLTDALLAQYGAVVTRYLKDKSKADGRFLLRYAAMLNEVGAKQRARKVYKTAFERGESAESYVGLHYEMTDRTGSYGTSKVITQNIRAAYEHVLGNSTRFSDMVDAANGDVVIVGNGPQELGTGHGALIDEKKMVIRFNSFPSHYPHIEDYGSKVDLWVRMQTGAYVKTDMRFAPRDIMLTGSNRLHRSITDWNWVADHIAAGFNMNVMPKEAFYHVMQSLGRVPTAGIVLAYMLYREIGPLREEQIFGCSFAKPNESDAGYHYGDPQAFLSQRHELDKEAEFFKTIRREKDVAYYTPYALRNGGPTAPGRGWSLEAYQGQFDRIISFSPGAEGYELFGCKVEFVPLKQGTAAEAATLTEVQGSPKRFGALSTITNMARCLFVGFGQQPSGQMARKIANKFGGQYMAVEYGLISSFHLPSEKKYNFSLILDDTGVFYDTKNPSRLEAILDQGFGAETNALTTRARKLVDLIVENRLTKYNNAPAMQLPPRKDGKHRILVIDQTNGDLSIEYGQCETYSFQDMLQHALDRENAEVFFKPHPETLAGAKNANFDIEELRARGGLTILEENCNIMTLLPQVDEVYVMVSGVGFEALMAGKTVRCFGAPFYAGRGLTIDMVEPLRPRRPVTIEELAAAVFLRCHQFYDPDTRQPTSPEACLETLVDKIRHRKSAPLISAGGAVVMADGGNRTDAAAVQAFARGELPLNDALLERFVGTGDTVVSIENGSGYIPLRLKDRNVFRVYAGTTSAAHADRLAALASDQMHPVLLNGGDGECPELESLLDGQKVALMQIDLAEGTVDVLRDLSGIFDRACPAAVLCWLQPHDFRVARELMSGWYPVVQEISEAGGISGPAEDLATQPEAPGLYLFTTGTDA